MPPSPRSPVRNFPSRATVKTFSPHCSVTRRPAARRTSHVASASASVLSLRAGNWKYISPSQGPKRNANTNPGTGNDPVGQLYDLATDPGETKNLAAEQPQRVAELVAQLEKLRSAGRLPADAPVAKDGKKAKQP